MIAHRSQLSWFRVIGIAGFIDGFSRPNTNMPICAEGEQSVSAQLTQDLEVNPTSSSCDKPRAIRRDVTTVYLKVFLLSAMSKPDGANVVHGNCRRVLTSGAYLSSKN